MRIYILMKIKNPDHHSLMPLRAMRDRPCPKLRIKWKSIKSNNPVNLFQLSKFSRWQPLSVPIRVSSRYKSVIECNNLGSGLQLDEWGKN